MTIRDVCSRKAVAFTIFLVTAFAVAETSAYNVGPPQDDVTILRWAGPPGTRPDMFEEWIASHPYTDFSFRVDRRTSLGGRAGAVAILTEASIAPSLTSEIDQLINSLTREGYTVGSYQISGGTPEDLRAFLQNLYNTDLIEGALFIGDLPVAWFQIENDYGSKGYAEWPIDLFYMDLDGDWLDTLKREVDSLVSGQDSIYDTHSGTVNPEIYVGRLTPTEIGDDTLLIKNYFCKDNAYRYHNPVELERRALVYIDDDWVPWAPGYASAVALLYNDTLVITDPEITKATDYRVRLDTVRAWVAVFAHSWPGGHMFYYNDGGSYDYYNSPEYTTQDPPANFYNHFACSFARYTAAGYGGGRSIFNQSYGLGAVGSTKTGSMLQFSYFYDPLSQGKNLGTAFKDWFTYITSDGVTSSEISWHYGMTLLGDPFLIPSGHPYVSVTYLKHTILDTFPDGNSDGIINPGETFEIDLWIQNHEDTLLSVTGDFITGADSVTLLNTVASFGDLLPGDSALGIPAYRFKVDPNVNDGYSIPCSLKISDLEGSSWVSTIQLSVVGQPMISVSPCSLVFDYTEEPDSRGLVVDTISYDEGALSYHSSINPYFGVRFSPPFPCTLKAALVNRQPIVGSYSDSLLLKSDGINGPGATLQALTYLPNTGTGWYTINFSPCYVDTAFWICDWIPYSNGCIRKDLNGGTGRSYESRDGLSWTQLSTTDLAIRAIISYRPIADSGIITVQNIGTGDLTIDSLSVKNNSDWVILSDEACIVAPGDSEYMIVQIDTTGLPTNKNYADTLVVFSNAINNPVEYVPLIIRFNDGFPIMTVSPDSILFDYAVRFETSPKLKFDSRGLVIDTIQYDEGPLSYNNSLNSYFAVRFSPPFACTLKSAIVYRAPVIGWASDSLLLKADGNNGPGATLQAFTYLPNTGTGWYKIDFSAFPIDTAFWICDWIPNSNGCVYKDRNGGTGRSYESRNGNNWTQLSTADFAIRAIINYVEAEDTVIVSDSGFVTVKNIGTAKLVIDSLSVKNKSDWLVGVFPVDGFTVLPGDSAYIMVQIDTTGLETTLNYTDTVMVFSNNSAKATDYIPVIVKFVEYPIGTEEETDGTCAAMGIRVYPNPFTSKANISCSGINKDQKVSLRIYDLSGRLVKTLIDNNSPLAAVVFWNGEDERGRKVAEGLYFLIMDVDGKRYIEKIIAIR